MTASLSNGLTPSCGLTADQVTEIRQLADVCNEHDRITLKLNFDMLVERPATECNDFLYYADEKLVGYLPLFQFNNREIEVSGMVHPDYRRRGIFTALYEAAREEVRKRGVPKLIFMVQQNSDSGNRFMEHLGARYEFTEHWMRLGEAQPLTLRDPIAIRPATVDDISTIASLLANAFHKDEAEQLASLKRRGATIGEKRFIVELSGQTIGTIGVNIEGENDEIAFLYGFCIHPDHQGKGYGRQALGLTTQNALARGCTCIELEVALDNMNALKLYQSCGFQVTNSNEYYVMMMLDESLAK